MKNNCCVFCASVEQRGVENKKIVFCSNPKCGCHTTPPQSLGNKEITLGDVLHWLRKLETLSSDGAKLAHVQHLLSSHKQYAHMCRDGHEQIGHNDSSSEMCPLCRAKADTNYVLQEVREKVEGKRRAQYDDDLYDEGYDNAVTTILSILDETIKKV